ncbi:MAG: mannitol dehydrogenase family protein [Tateyamaria sp.]|jgi:fructuronate reductase|nr:mannitol dehydrogenase family protein [Tateyamaria sp.]MBT5302977.1 mannitol dehydrogenase family protein [Tateyamaria sp.]MBT6344114.1 mannitol dehydrogenase family protein [Tateyamaria sp.]MBT7447697.1 mannitol dehydrogenase family protein [Tateyamaria sp.]MBT7801866.1 mannitol dehydrogenase family protein [Tateyamaria sp.]
MPRILHLGVGNFFRAHQAWYTQRCPEWNITGVSFRSSSVRDHLVTQDYSYKLVIKDTLGTKIETITCLDSILVMVENPEAVISAITDPLFNVITLTVTEKAYCLGPDGKLNQNDPAIREDLNGGKLTLIGTLARGLAKRKKPITILSCDNLPENGQKLKSAVQTFTELANLEIKANITYPSCMVDRITPATTDKIRLEAHDHMAVPTEEFTEWVVENDFASARPDWPNVQWVDDVLPHEMRKLRMLNGAHSYLAYAGIIRGYTFVHEAIADPILRTGAFKIMAEAAQTLPKDIQNQTKDYSAALIKRFENPNLLHRLRQIAMDGSEKLPIRIVSTITHRDKLESPALNAAITAWISFVQKEVTEGHLLDDPKASQIAEACLSDDPDTELRNLIGAC